MSAKGISPADHESKKLQPDPSGSQLKGAINDRVGLIPAGGSPATPGEEARSSIAAVVAGLLAGEDTSTLSELVLQAAATETEADRASLAYVEGDVVLIDGLVRNSNQPDEVDRFVRSQRSADLRTFRSHPLVRLATEQRTAVVGLAMDSDRERSNSSRLVLDLQHLAVAPFFRRDLLLGTMTVSRSRERPFDPGAIRRLQELANIAGLVLQESHLRQEVDAVRSRALATADRLRRALDAARDIAGVGTVEEASRRVLTRAAQATGATHGLISRIVTDQLIAEFELESARPRRRRGLPVPIAKVPGAARAVAERATVVAFPGAPIRSHSLRSGDRRRPAYTLFCPLIASGDIVGMLELSRIDHAFGPDDVAVLDHFASMAALLLKSARLLQEARAGGESKARFLNLAAHELRTPLSVIRGYLSMIEDGTLAPSEAILPAVEVIRRKSDELNSLVESMLLVARLDAGAVLYEPVAINLADLVTAAVDRLRPQLDLRGGQIDVRLPAEPAWILVDPAAIGKILDNLLANSATYSSGPPEIIVAVELVEGAAQVVVQDRGLGISKKDQSRLFERFHRSAAVSPHAGAGLGLAVSRELAEAVGGSLVLLWSREGEGSAFRLRLGEARDAGVG